MDALSTIGVVLLVLGLATQYYARFLLREQKKLTSSQLTRQYPHLRWVRWGYPALMVVPFWSLFLGLYLAARHYGWDSTDHFVLLVGPLISIISLVEGFFALATGVYSASTRIDVLYVCDVDRRLNRVAYVQIAAAIVIIATGITGYLVLR